ncbi:hypothetical protein [Luteipulveratus halotolerans]|uniref:Uncharacterized protein n=1 Tax=Luteipulveratus halotolerans TaxID=1631356 RepID=A0A0L6CFM1_9MICO|nr:hypothetical protein [Luteipulveratus halotolerans]KNX36484.1 hypothetical protein VV01_03875 [Luteipulveratus halotolerans]
MRAVSLTVFVALLLLLAGHLCLVVRDALFERVLGDGRQPAHVAIGDELLSPRRVFLAMGVFVVGYIAFVNLSPEPAMTVPALVVLGFLIGWGCWVLVRVALRRKVIGDAPVPWWSVVPPALAVAAAFAWSGIA